MMVANQLRQLIAALTCVVVAATMVAANGTATAAPPQPIQPVRPDLAEYSLKAAAGTTDPHGLATVVERSRGAVTAQAAANPNTVTSAAVVFSGGLTVAAAAATANARKVEIVQAEAKVALRSGEVYGIWLMDFGRFPGSTEASLERAIGKARLQLFKDALTKPSAREAATGDIRIYRLDVVATMAQLAGLNGDRSVAAVVADQGATKVDGLRSRQARAMPATTHARVRLSSGDPVSGSTGAPVLASGETCQWQPGASSLACQKTTAAPSSAGGVNLTKPTPGAPEVGAALADVSTVIGCNTTGAPERCPADATYRPHPNTGGSENMGVNVVNFFEGYNYFYDCYAIWVPDPNGSPDGPGGYWATVCDVYVYYSPAFTLGAAAWNSRWGTNKITVSSVGVDVPISTLAFQGAGLVPDCDVDQFLATADCDASDRDATYVENPGVEDELNIGNPGCRITRNGTASDADSGCFSPTLAISNYPPGSGWEIDTTFLDGPGPAPYNLAILVAFPIRIEEGVTYSNYVEFMSWGNNNMAGQTAHHTVAVDSKVSLSAICLARGTNPFCYFPVDSSRVSPIYPFV